MTDQPTPEQLAQRMRDFDPNVSDADEVMRRIIVDAEAGGEAHMLAVVGALPPPTPAPPAPTDILHDLKTRRASYRDPSLNVTMSLIVNTDGFRYEARETVDAFMWEMQFRSSPEHFESYIAHWLRVHLGSMVQDPVAFGHFRAKLFIVTPEDIHDRRVCRRTSEEDGQQMVHWPRCIDGAILTEPPIKEPELSGTDRPLFGSMFGPHVRPQAVKGACTCRCHPGWLIDNVVHGLRTTVCDL